MASVDSIPLFGSVEGRRAEIVRCSFGHLGARETFEELGGCPYCMYTPGERVAALRAKQAAGRREGPGSEAPETN